MVEESEKDDIDPLDIEDLQLIEESLILAYKDEDKNNNDWYNDEYIGEILAKIVIGRMRLEIEKELENAEGEVISKVDEDCTRKDLQTIIETKKIRSTSLQIMNYFVLVSTFIETLSIDLLKKELIADEHSDTKKTDTIIEHRFDQELREDLLFRTGIIDEPLKSELSHIRVIRNSLVHDFNNHLLLEAINDVSSELRRVYNAYSELFDQVNEDDTVELKTAIDSK
jgi:hypothetical protein